MKCPVRVVAMVLLASGVGCLSIPLPSRVSSTHIYERGVVVDTRSVGPLHLELELVDGEVRGEATRAGEWTLVDRSLETRTFRRLAVGVLPGTGAKTVWNPDSPPSDADWFDPVNPLYWVGAALFTPFQFFGWFEGWTPVESFHYDNVVEELREFVAVGVVPFGWDESVGAVESERRIVAAPPQPVAGRRLLIRSEHPLFSNTAEVTTDDEGRFVILDVKRWRFLDWPDESAMTLSFYDSENEEERLGAITIPGSEVGTDFFDELHSGRFRGETIYSPEGRLDFSAADPALPPRAHATVRVVGQDPRTPASLGVEVTVENRGRGDLAQLYVWTASRVSALDRHFAVFGRVKPGESMTRRLAFPVDGIAEDADPASVTLAFSECNQNQPPPRTIAIDAATLARPRLDWTYRIVDDERRSDRATGNGDGVIQRGEAVEVVLSVKNVGSARATDVVLVASLPEAEHLRVYGDARFDLGPLPPGAMAERRVLIQIKPTSTQDEFPLTVGLEEAGFSLSATDRVALPFDAVVAPRPIAIDRTVYVEAPEAVLRVGASPDAAEYGRAARGAALHAVGELGEWLEIEAQEGPTETTAWVLRREITLSAPLGGSVEPLVVTRFEVPPIVNFIEPSGTPRLVTTEARVEVVVSVTAPTSRLEDARIELAKPGESFRGLTLAPEAAPTGRGRSRVLRQRVDLTLGENRIRVVAVDEAGLRTERVLTVVREEVEGKTYLLAVGIDAYPLGRELHCAVSDARRFSRFAKSQLGVDDDESVLLVEEQATRAAILDAFARLLDVVTAADTVIVFLAGHGHLERVGDREQRYFVPHVDQWGRFFSSAIRTSEFEEVLSALRARKVLVIADACHSSDVIAMRGDDGLFSGLAGEGRIIIGYRGRAREDRTLGHGYLTHFLLEGIESGDADVDDDEEISIREAFDYANRRVETITGEALWIQGDGRLRLVRER